MIIRRNFADKYYEDERLYSTGDDYLDEMLEKAFCEGYEYAQKEFGAKSKALAIFAPGAYQGKEAAKYAYDNEDDYKEHRGKYALLGAFTPGTATIVKKKAEKMHDEGKSAEEIREYLEGKGKYKKDKNKRIALGFGEAATGGFGGLGTLAAEGVGLAVVITGDRKKFKKSKKDRD